MSDNTQLLNAIDFFGHPDAKLPLTRQIDNFGAFMKERFSKYRDLVSRLDTKDPIAESIKHEEAGIATLCHKIEQAITAYHGGWPKQAYLRLEEGMEAIWPEIQMLSPFLKNPVLRQLYRMRVAGPEGGEFTKGDLFHIPYESRHLVNRQRYSIPGLPCLYLGASLYVCWEEMGRPAFDSVYMARFEVNESVRILDMSLSPATLSACMTQRPATPPPTASCVSLAVCWPLMAACSVETKYPKAPFIEEYIVPQLLLQWVTERNHVDAIAFFSVKLKPRTDNFLANINFVFPSKGAGQPTGFCEKLRRLFIVTEPVSWQLLAGTSRIAIVGGNLPVPINSQMWIELIRGKSERYESTQFGRMEEELLRLPCSPLLS